MMAPMPLKDLKGGSGRRGLRMSMCIQPGTARTCGRAYNARAANVGTSPNIAHQTQHVMACETLRHLRQRNRMRYECLWWARACIAYSELERLDTTMSNVQEPTSERPSAPHEEDNGLDNCTWRSAKLRDKLSADQRLHAGHATRTAAFCLLLTCAATRWASESTLQNVSTWPEPTMSVRQARALN